MAVTPRRLRTLLGHVAAPQGLEGVAAAGDNGSDLVSDSVRLPLFCMGNVAFEEVRQAVTCMAGPAQSVYARIIAGVYATVTAPELHVGRSYSFVSGCAWIRPRARRMASHRWRSTCSSRGSA